MDFHAAMETFAEAWVAANTQTAVNTEGQMVKQTSAEDLPTQLPKQQLLVTTTTPTKQPPPEPRPESPSSASSTKSLPIHCIIEQTTGAPTFDVTPDDPASTHTAVELDSYAILPGTTLLSECVHAALVKLGYTSVETMGAKGAIQIKNWKPLNFESIAESKSANIDDVLGELTQVATLRIRICSPTKLSSAEEMKEKLLQLLLNQSQSLLTHTGCPIDKGVLASVSNGQSLSTISPEMRRAFDKWYSEQVRNFRGNNLNLALAAKDLLSVPPPVAPPACPSPSQVSPPLVARPTASSTPAVSPHPAFAQQYQLPGKTRMRTSFDPEHEIPRLQRWFVDNQHPSREHMVHYLTELNSLASRKGRRPLDLTNIIYWFKNARAAQRRASKNSFSGDDSFEMEEDKECVMTPQEGLPFLPNRNAVYMVPYPLHPNMGQNIGLQNGHNDWREPCDLSMNSKSNTHAAKTSSLSADDNASRSSDSPRSAHGLESNVSVNQNEPVRVKVELDNSCDATALNVGSQPVESDDTVDKANDAVDTDYDSSEKDVDSAEKENDIANKEAEITPVPHAAELPNKPFRIEANVITYQSDLTSRPNDLSYDKQKDFDQPRDLSLERARDFSMGLPRDLSRERPVHISDGRPRDLTNINDGRPRDLTNINDGRPRDLTNINDGRPRDLTNINGKREYESDDDLESDDDDDQSADGSHSSHDEDRMTKLRETYMNAARGLNYNPVSSANPTGQPLHIPQFPHPLAMHYFPLNSHLYAQQANQMKYAGHPQPSHHPAKSGQGQENNSHRKRRTRVFIDPLSEIPKLEKWFLDDTHPSSYMIDKYCEELNSSEYRQKFPKLESKNVQLWFKNHRAKVKRMRVSNGDSHLPIFD